MNLAAILGRLSPMYHIPELNRARADLIKTTAAVDLLTSQAMYGHIDRSRLLSGLEEEEDKCEQLLEELRQLRPWPNLAEKVLNDTKEEVQGTLQKIRKHKRHIERAESRSAQPSFWGQYGPIAKKSGAAAAALGVGGLCLGGICRRGGSRSRRQENEQLLKFFAPPPFEGKRPDSTGAEMYDISSDNENQQGQERRRAVAPRKGTTRNRKSSSSS
jgi:hypothetical protein